MATTKTNTKMLGDLFLDTLKDIYFAEEQILKALPKMDRAAKSELGKAGFLQHRDETQGQIERLEQVFELLGKPAQGKTCEAIQGIISEGEQIMEEFKGSPALDAGLILGSGGRALRDRLLRHPDCLGDPAWPEGCNPATPGNLDEEEATDRKLTQIAKTAANAKDAKAA